MTNDRILQLNADLPAEPQSRATLQVVGDGQEGGYYGFSEAIVTGGVAAIEAVAGRAAKLMRMATVESSNPHARSLLTPPNLSMIARQLVVRGEVLFWLEPYRGMLQAHPAQWDWVVNGPPNPWLWTIGATVSGAQWVTDEFGKNRQHWLYILQEPEPDYPWRGVAAVNRAGLTHAILRGAEEALRAETRQPVKSIVAYPDGVGDDAVKDMKSRIMDRMVPVMLPPTTSRGFGAGATNAPQSDWTPRRMQPAPQQWLVELADRTSARIVAALGAHPQIIGAGSGTGTISRDARRQFEEVIRDPMAKLIEYETGLLLGREVRLRFEPNPDTRGVIANAMKTELEVEKLKKEMAAGPPSEPAP